MNKYLSSKPRYEILDGLRGVAALIVLAYHHGDVYWGSDPVNAWINHGYLAVDFFFMLSGFVIGYAYDDRWNKMSLWDFFKRRLVRLHPMIVLSTIIAMIFFYYGIGSYFPAACEAPVWKVLATGLLTILLIPSPRALDVRGWSEMFPLNGNVWTLHFEYIANIMYALFIRKFSKLLLSIFVFLSALLTLNLALNIDVFGLFEERTLHAYTMTAGWENSLSHAFIAFSRLLFPFFAGLLMSRCGFKFRVKNGFGWCSLAIALALLMPRIGGEEHGLWNGIYEAVMVLAFFPLIVAAGAGSEVSGKTAKVCKFLGEISYPLYIIQYPIAYVLFGSWVTTYQDVPTEMSVFMNIGTYLLSIGIAWASYKLFDVPVREWLKNRFLVKSK